MFKHFFKSLSDAAKMNLNIKAEGENEHHKIEGIFKALARSLKMAVKRDIYHFEGNAVKKRRTSRKNAVKKCQKIWLHQKKAVSLQIHKGRFG